MNVLNKDYLQLQEEISSLIENWSKHLENHTLINPASFEKIQQFPALPQVEYKIDFHQYRSFMVELLSLLKEKQPLLAEDLNKLEMELSEGVLEAWFGEVTKVNEEYFERFAKENKMAEWLPFFVAENAIRPYLQKASSEMKDVLQKAEVHGGCPACGEPSRLAVINKKGKKEITCPRCSYAWEEKKISCAHCGCEEPGQIEILKIEEDEASEIHVCNECKGYTKVVDVRKMIKVDPPQLLDQKSIHLDYIAQEQGYGIPEVKKTH